MAQLGEIMHQQLGAVVSGPACEIDLAVPEGALHHQQVQAVVCIQGLPQAVVAGAVTGIGEGPAVALHPVAAGGHGVDGRQHIDAPRAEGDGLAPFHGTEAHHRGVRGRQGLEIRPDLPVEDVCLQDLDARRRGIDHQRRILELGEQGIHQHGEAGHVVHVGMGQEHMTDPAELVGGQVTHPGAAVQQDVVIHTQGRGPSATADPATATEHLYAHAMILQPIRPRGRRAETPAPELVIGIETK